jgi:hypothetical protein
LHQPPVAVPANIFLDKINELRRIFEIKIERVDDVAPTAMAECGKYLISDEIK